MTLIARNGISLIESGRHRGSTRRWRFLPLTCLGIVAHYMGFVAVAARRLVVVS